MIVAEFLRRPLTRIICRISCKALHINQLYCTTLYDAGRCSDSTLLYGGIYVRTSLDINGSIFRRPDTVDITNDQVFRSRPVFDIDASFLPKWSSTVSDFIVSEIRWQYLKGSVAPCPNEQRRVERLRDPKRVHRHVTAQLPPSVARYPHRNYAEQADDDGNCQKPVVCPVYARDGRACIWYDLPMRL